MTNESIKDPTFGWSPTETRRVFTLEQREAAINLAVEIGLTKASIELDIPRETIGRFVKDAGKRLPSVGRGAGAYRTYSEEDRERAVEAALDVGAAKAARSLGIPGPTLLKWLESEPRYVPKKRSSYTLEQRAEAVRLTMECGIKEASHQSNIPEGTIKNWLPYKAPHQRRQYRNHTTEFARNAADLAMSTTIAEAAETLGLSGSTVRTWRNRSLGKLPPGRPAPKRYDAEQKAAVLADVPLLGFAATAEKHGVSRQTVGDWARAAGVSPPNRPGHTKVFDQSMNWVERECPSMVPWKRLAVEWLASSPGAIKEKLQALKTFIVAYLVGLSLPSNPRDFLRAADAAPSFYEAACRKTEYGATVNNYIYQFIEWLLESQHFRADPLRGELSNPLKRIPYNTAKAGQTVYPLLPYHYVLELRRMLAQGLHFSDWTWAQSMSGTVPGTPGAAGHCWFEVDESKIDKTDPDCVWRRRFRIDAPSVLEMWSPVRWVLLLFKLNLPHRPGQVRLVDSGEADTWRYEYDLPTNSGSWVENDGALRDGSIDRPLRQGFFQRFHEHTSPEMRASGTSPNAIIYLNTNKTDDRRSTHTRRGIETPWMVTGSHEGNVFYWGTRLRNWQEKYNPISRRTSWADLDGRHFDPKHRDTLSTYPDACFLFRAPEAGPRESHLPLHRGAYDRPYYLLMQELERKLAARGEVHADGRPIRLVATDSDRKALFPLYSTRVTLITVLLEDAGVPPQIVQRVVGHTRIAMTWHYNKLDAGTTFVTLQKAAASLEEKSEATLAAFLENAKFDDLVTKVVVNSTDALTAAIPLDSHARNSLGWMRMHLGVCLVGGNTVPMGEGSCGCFNGGPNIGSSTSPKHEGVPGGPRNCVRCRWLATGIEYLGALVAHLNALLFHHDEAAHKCVELELELSNLQTRRALDEADDNVFKQQHDLDSARNRLENALVEYDSRIKDVAACYRLIKECEARWLTQNESAVVLTGGPEAPRLEWSELPTELHQLHLLCTGAELYPDIDVGKAILMRGQRLDQALERHGCKPYFFRLTEEQQLRVGNAFIRSLAVTLGAERQLESEAEVLDVLSASTRLESLLGVNLTENLCRAHAESESEE